MLNSWCDTQYAPERGPHGRRGSHSVCFGHLFVIRIQSHDFLNNRSIVSVRVANSFIFKCILDRTNGDFLPIITFNDS